MQPTPDHTVETPGRAVTFSGFSPGSEEPPLLEGRLYVPADGTLHPGVVLCHSNPAAGGHIDTTLMIALEVALIEDGFATLQYNSRGVRGSGGTISRGHDKKLVAPEGMPETEDVGAALRFLGAQDGVNNRKMALVGHSFGARVLLAYLAAHPEEAHVGAAVPIGLAVGWRDLSHLGQWPHPKLFVTGERDDFCPPDKLRQFVDTLPQPSTTTVLKETGHFFEGRQRDLGRIVAAFLKQVLG
ncbi:MAG TPA: alpha/beta fold hydrolase [Chloroflexia bacterium]|nr:alpha/beta fold hydrolase [Chloroflexia bacterium]